MFLDYAEDQMKRRKQIYMQEWPKKLDAFLDFNERSVLTGPGKWERGAPGTGAEPGRPTLGACREALLGAGAASVRVVVAVARTG